VRTLFAIAIVMLVVFSAGCPSKPRDTARTGTLPAETLAAAPVSESAAAVQPKPAASAEPANLERKPGTELSAPPAQAAGLPKLWDFGAEWCPPCRDQKPIVIALQSEYAGKVEIRIIDVDENKDLSEKFKVKAIPTQVFMDKDGNTLSQHVGLFPKDSIVARFRAHGFIQ